MAQHQLPKPARIALRLSPVALVMIAFFAALPLLKAISDDAVLVTGAVAAIVVMAYSVYVSIRLQRSQDEVQRAGSRFAFQVGALGGSILTVLMLTAPPFQNALVDAASRLATGSAETVDREAVLLAAFMGFVLLSVAQTLGTLVAHAGWSWWVNRE